MSYDDVVKAHYALTTLASDIDASLRVLGKDPARITVDDLELIDEFHMGGRAATTRLFETAGFAAGARLLDVGSGYGGPARVGAAQFGLDVTGIDLTPAYVATATDLSRRTGLTAATRFEVASALALPFAAGAFDGAIMIHVGMNIADKTTLMKEVRRVLKPRSTFAVYDIMRTGPGDLTFPLPWSSVAETSAVATADDYRTALVGAGFTAIEIHAGRGAARPPAPATLVSLPHRGPGWDVKTANLATLGKAGVLTPMLVIARSPG